MYGEFTSIWRLWKVYYDSFPNKKALTAKADEYYWELLKRAADVEGGMESVFVKLASEKIIEPRDITALGLFRQAIQQLRQSIREYEEMNWQRKHKEYILLKDLVINTALLINSKTKSPECETAKKQLAQITLVDSGVWSLEVAK